MAGSRNNVTTVSIVIAVLCAGWAIYATKHADGGGAGAGGPGMGGPAMGPAMGGAAAGGPGPGRPGAGSGPAGAGRPGGPPGMGGMPVPVVSAIVRKQDLVRELRALGTARANEAIEVTSKASNIVAAVRFRDGQAVARGQVLVELDGAQARADLAVANAALGESTSQYNRSRELLATQALSKSQFEQLESAKLANEARVAAARARLEDTVIRAPFGGRVGLRRVSVGTLISPGTVITTLDDISVIKVDFAVPENDLASLRDGLAVVAQTAAFPERRFAGRVLSVDSRVDPTTRSVAVRAELPNSGGLLKPGMFLTVELLRDQRSAVVIPEEALVPEQNKQFVFVVSGGKSLKREVRIGARRPGSVEIVTGLAAGERVIVEGTVKVRDGGAIRDLAADVAAPPLAAESRR